MIRLRKVNGEFLELPPDYQFVEVTDVDGKIGVVLFQQGPSYVTFDKESDEAKRYSKLYRDVVFCEVQR
jgi:hypothetical protein